MPLVYLPVAFVHGLVCACPPLPDLEVHQYHRYDPAIEECAVVSPIRRSMSPRSDTRGPLSPAKLHPAPSPTPCWAPPYPTPPLLYPAGPNPMSCRTHNQHNMLGVQGLYCIWPTVANMTEGDTSCSLLLELLCAASMSQDGTLSTRQAGRWNAMEV